MMEWIKNTGVQPVRDGVRVRIVLSDLSLFTTDWPENEDWSIENIIEYQIVENSK